MTINLERPLTFIDVETTGTSTLIDKIVEFSAIRINPDRTQRSLSIRINPGIPIPPEATAIHGITDADVAEESVFKEKATAIQAFLDGCDIGGFNVRKFDLDILEAEFRNAGVEFSRQGRYVIDVQTIYHKMDPRDLPAAYRKYCGKEHENAHHSAADAQATAEIFFAQVQTHDLPRNLKELHEMCEEHRHPSWIDSKGKFIWVNDMAVVNFGQHKGKSLQYMTANESEYLKWIATSDFLPDVKKLVMDALKRIFPQK